MSMSIPHGSLDTQFHDLKKRYGNFGIEALNYLEPNLQPFLWIYKDNRCSFENIIICCARTCSAFHLTSQRCQRSNFWKPLEWLKTKSVGQITEEKSVLALINSDKAVGYIHKTTSLFQPLVFYNNISAQFK